MLKQGHLAQAAILVIGVALSYKLIQPLSRPAQPEALAPQVRTIVSLLRSRQASLEAYKRVHGSYPVSVHDAPVSLLPQSEGMPYYYRYLDTLETGLTAEYEIYYRSDGQGREYGLFAIGKSADAAPVNERQRSYFLDSSGIVKHCVPVDRDQFSAFTDLPVDSSPGICRQSRPTLAAS